MEKDKSAFMLLLRDINAICNNRINIAEKDCRPENNFFLQKCFYNKIFREQSLRKIERLYSKYKNNDKEINYAIELIKGLFSKNWTGSYSELCAYDLINLCFENPCNIQLTNKEKIKTLAKFYKNRKGTTTVDGYISDILTFFEVKSLSNNTLEQINKLKNEIYQETSGNFRFSVEYPDDEDISDYGSLKREILYAYKDRIKFFSSSTNPKFNIRLYYNEKIIIDMHAIETSFAKAERLEMLPLNKAYQFVDGHFIKIFVCHSLNLNNSLIDDYTFFRSLSRRVFCKLTKDNTLIDLNCSLSVSDVAKKLSGLMFIVDLSATKVEKSVNNPKQLYNVYLFANPNADFGHDFIGFRNFYQVLNGVNKRCADDFQYDNY